MKIFYISYVSARNLNHSPCLIIFCPILLKRSLTTSDIWLRWPSFWVVSNNYCNKSWYMWNLRNNQNTSGQPFIVCQKVFTSSRNFWYYLSFYQRCYALFWEMCLFEIQIALVSCIYTNVFTVMKFFHRATILLYVNLLEVILVLWLISLT